MYRGCTQGFLAKVILLTTHRFVSALLSGLWTNLILPFLDAHKSTIAQIFQNRPSRLACLTQDTSWWVSLPTATSVVPPPDPYSSDGQQAGSVLHQDKSTSWPGSLEWIGTMPLTIGCRSCERSRAKFWLTTIQRSSVRKTKRSQMTAPSY